MHFNKVFLLIFISFLSCVDLSAQFKIKGIGIEYTGVISNTYLEQAPVYYRNITDMNVSLNMYFDINKHSFQFYYASMSRGLDSYVQDIRQINRVSRLERETRRTFDNYGINYIKPLKNNRFTGIDLILGVGVKRLNDQVNPSISGGISTSSAFNTTADFTQTTSEISFVHDWIPFLKNRLEFITKPLKFIELVTFVEYNYAFGINLFEGSVSTYTISESWADGFDEIRNNTYLDDNVHTQKIDVSASNLGFGVMTRVKF